jgi:hypothetical protein
MHGWKLNGETLLEYILKMTLPAVFTPVFRLLQPPIIRFCSRKKNFTPLYVTVILDV